MANTSGPQADIGNGQTMNADAAHHFRALVAEILDETGIEIRPTEGTRTYARQSILYTGWLARLPGFNPAWSPDSPFAYHLSGRAVDVGSGVGYVATLASKAFYERAGKYGFRPTVAGEPWHFEWRADWVGVSLEVAGSRPVVIPPAPDHEELTVSQYESIMRELGTVKAAVGRIDERTATTETELAVVKAATGRIEAGVSDIVTKIKPAVGRIANAVSRFRK